MERGAGRADGTCGCSAGSPEGEAAATEKVLGDSIRDTETGGASGYRTNLLGELVVWCDELCDELAAEEEDLPPKVSVGKADAYAKKAVRIIDALARMKDDVGVRAAIRQLVGKVVITPTPGREPVEVRVEARIAGVFALEVSELEGEPRVR